MHPRLRPTRRFPGMLLAAGLVYFFATNSQVIWLYLVTALVAGLALTGLLAPLAAIRRVRPRLVGYERSGFSPPLPQDRGRLFAGDTLTLVLELGRPAPIALGPVRTGTRDRAARARVEGRRATVTLHAESRGELRVDRVLCTSSWPLGIARAERWIELERSFVVHPRYALPALRRRRGHLQPAGASVRRGTGDEFLGLREYRAGDSQRRIHWQTSARSGTLMVIETAEESSSSGVYDVHLSPAAAAGTCDLAVSVAASMAAADVVEGVPISLGLPGAPRALGRWPEVLGALAVAQPGGQRSPARRRDAVVVEALATGVRVTRGDTTTVLDPGQDLEAALALLEGLR